MQNFNHLSLNALRVFCVVADCSSMKLAAARLGVTAGAVSLQVRRLEETLGLQLLHRANNSIQLTDAGAFLHNQSLPALRSLRGTVETLLSGQEEVSVLVPVTLAIRWLIPRLEGFRSRNPGLRIRIETTMMTGSPPVGGADVTLAYYPQSVLPDSADVLLEDRCRPYLSPDLLKRIGESWRLEDIPALESASESWDWAVWLAKTGRDGTALHLSGRFDLDDAALRAAVAGVGMVLAPEFIISDDLSSGRLCALPDTEDVLLGSYVLHRPASPSRAVDRFVDWLRCSAVT